MDPAAVCLDSPDTANNKAVGVTLGSTTVKNNQADEGGSVALGKESSLTSTSCVFQENNAKKEVLYAGEKNNLDIRDSEFKGNKATETYGGAIESLSCSSMELSKVIFDANEAERRAVYLVTEVSNCLNTLLELEFKNNKVKTSGRKVVLLCI